MQTGLLPRCDVLLNAFEIINELRRYVSTVNGNQPRPSSPSNSQIPWMPSSPWRENMELDGMNLKIIKMKTASHPFQHMTQ